MNDPINDFANYISKEKCEIDSIDIWKEEDSRKYWCLKIEAGGFIYKVKSDTVCGLFWSVYADLNNENTPTSPL